jgi:hypothetical protein
MPSSLRWFYTKALGVVHSLAILFPTRLKIPHDFGDRTSFRKWMIDDGFRTSLQDMPTLIRVLLRMDLQDGRWSAQWSDVESSLVERRHSYLVPKLYGNPLKNPTWPRLICRGRPQS